MCVCVLSVCVNKEKIKLNLNQGGQQRFPYQTQDMTLEFKYLIPETPTLAFHFLYRDIFSNVSVCCMSITNTPLERFKCSTQLFWIIWITSCGRFRNLKHLLQVFKSRLSKLLSSAVSPFLFLILHIPGPAVCMQVISAQLPTQHDKYVLHPLLVPT